MPEPSDCTCVVLCDSEQDTGCLYCRTVDPELPCPNLDCPGCPGGDA